MKQGAAVKLTAKLGNIATIRLVSSYSRNGVLVDSLQLCVVLCFALEVHLFEHVQGGLFALVTAQSGSTLGLQGPAQLPTGSIALETEGLTVVTSSHNLALRRPDQTHEWQKLRIDADDSTGWLLGGSGVDNSNAAVMSGKGESITAWRESDRVDPPGRVVHKLAADGVERQALTPNTGIRAGIDTLDEAGENSSMGIGGSGSQENTVGVPGDSGNGTPDRLLQVLRNPPVILFLEVADSDDAVSRSDSELSLGRRPSNKSGGSGDSKQDQCRLVTCRGWLPNEGISICCSVNIVTETAIASSTHPESK